jgi:hypothetical protein
LIESACFHWPIILFEGRCKKWVKIRASGIERMIINRTLQRRFIIRMASTIRLLDHPSPSTEKVDAISRSTHQLTAGLVGFGALARRVLQHPHTNLSPAKDSFLALDLANDRETPTPPS